MSKYTPEELQYMARDFAAAAACNDLNCQLLVGNLVMITGLTREQILLKIKELANWN